MVSVSACCSMCSTWQSSGLSSTTNRQDSLPLPIVRTVFHYQSSGLSSTTNRQDSLPLPIVRTVFHYQSSGLSSTTNRQDCLPLPIVRTVFHYQSSGLSSTTNRQDCLPLPIVRTVFHYQSSTMNFIKLGGVRSCLMAHSIIFLHNYNRILTDEAENTMIIWEKKILRAPFTVENSSILINFSLLGFRHFILHEIILKNKNLLLRN